MKDINKAKLDAILRAHEATKQTLREATDAKAVEDRRYLDQFLETRERVIRSAMDGVGEYLSERGYAFQIEEQEQVVEHDGRSTPASITMFIFGKHERRAPNSEFPHVSFSWDRYSRKVNVYERRMYPSGGGSAGPEGSLGLEELSDEIVEARIIGLIGKVLT